METMGGLSLPVVARTSIRSEKGNLDCDAMAV